MEESNRSFSSRRPATEALPPFHMPPRPTSDIPRAADGISPVLSSMASAGSQASQAHPGVSQPPHYTFGHGHGSWPTPGSAYGGPSSPTQTRQPSGAPQFENRPQSIFNQAPTGAPYMNRSSHSPATGADGLPAPYEQPQLQHFQSHLGPGPGGHPVTQAPPPAPTNGAADVDPYTQTRPPSGPSYPITAPPPNQYPLPSPTQQPSPSTLPHRGLGMGGGFGQPPQPAMAPPNPYRQGYHYQPVHGIPGGMMSGMQAPGGQMAMVPGLSAMGHHPMGQHYMYAQPQASPPVDRPFKCDQCIQSFSRNHDLKRHKRIHLAVKPFPCGQCNKQFSRKDALKRHRLVKGCDENAKKEANEANGQNANSETGDDNTNSPMGSGAT